MLFFSSSVQFSINWLLKEQWEHFQFFKTKNQLVVLQRDVPTFTEKEKAKVIYLQSYNHVSQSIFECYVKACDLG